MKIHEKKYWHKKNTKIMFNQNFFHFLTKLMNAFPESFWLIVLKTVFILSILFEFENSIYPRFFEK